MESYQNQSGVQQTDQQLDQYGNPVPTPAGVYGTEAGGLSGMLHRSGSSSSSEDDGHGGRRRKKKRITQKIKEKLPCHHQNEATTAYDATGTCEKKGMMEKIKEKLPGGAHH